MRALVSITHPILTSPASFRLMLTTRSLLPHQFSAPVGTRHRPRKEPSVPAEKESLKPAPQSSAKLSAEQRAAIEKELEGLPDLIQTKYGAWKDGARDFQLACMRAQVLRQDVLLHAATGSGKTGIAAGPHLLPSSAGKVTLVVSPLLALQEEQVRVLLRDLIRIKLRWCR